MVSCCKNITYSQWAANHGASNARLHRPAGGGRTGAWSAKTNDKSQWIQADLRGKFKVTKILTQGRHDYAQWVTQYKVSYSSDGVHFSDRNKVSSKLSIFTVFFIVCAGLIMYAIPLKLKRVLYPLLSHYFDM